MKILFLASEIDPLAKTGGLADVAAALPKALGRLGHDVRVAMPLYRQVDRKKFALRPTGRSVNVTLAGQSLAGAWWEGVLPQTTVPVYLLEQSTFFDRDGLYQAQGKDHPDNLARFSFFSQASLQLPSALGWMPEVLHAHDWQAALACAHLAWGPASRDPHLASTASVFTVHNLAYQGAFPRDQWAMTGLPEALFSIDGLEFYGQLNCLKGALVSAKTLTTVSAAYAREIQTPEFGCGLEGVLRARVQDLVGILNGIDPEEWNPQTDPHIAARYSAEQLAGKALCKLALQKRHKLPEQHGLLIGMIQRLAEQKGIDIFIDAMDALMGLPVQIVLLGTGDPVYHRQLEAMATRFPQRLAVNLTFDNALAHQIEAGADAFLMPSRFEPCGLNQMYSMRYGTVPIVRKVGGLSDTVTDLTPEAIASRRATGFVIDSHTAGALVEAVKRALTAFQQPPLWTHLMQAGMRQECSWDRSARDYLKVYERAAAKRPVVAR